MAPDRQRGFSIVEVIVAIVVVAILATAFLSAFSSVLRSSVSPMQIAVMESIAAGQMDKALSNSYLSAIMMSGTTTTFSIDGTNYDAVFLGQSSVVNGATVNSGIHLTVTVTTNNCVSCVSLSGDNFHVQ